MVCFSGEWSVDFDDFELVLRDPIGTRTTVAGHDAVIELVADLFLKLLERGAFHFFEFRIRNFNPDDHVALLCAGSTGFYCLSVHRDLACRGINHSDAVERLTEYLLPIEDGARQIFDFLFPKIL
jgi:hypothetical protein